MRKRWLQIRGDPSVRQFVFDQERIASEFDLRLDDVLARTEVLLRAHGVFHAKIHFSSGQVTLWLLQDPLRYRVHIKEEFLNPMFCLPYGRAPYTRLATVPESVVPQVLAQFRRLRSQDQHIYLRSGSINIINGLVGLNFSCDGSHYIDYAEFLANASQLYS